MSDGKTALELLRGLPSSLVDAAAATICGLHNYALQDKAARAIVAAYKEGGEPACQQAIDSVAQAERERIRKQTLLRYRDEDPRQSSAPC